MTQDVTPYPDFGEPLALEDLIRLTEISEWEDDATARNAALDTAIEWWNESASLTFIGALDAE